MPLARYFHRRERYFAKLNDNRIARPFEWGTEFADPAFLSNSNGAAPAPFWRNYAQNAVVNSDHFFALNNQFDFQSAISNPQSAIELTWTSQTETPSPENNTVRARFFRAENQKRKRAVVVLPHWNARAESYFALCRVLNRVGISALRLTMPYHEERMPPELERAEYLVCPNIGRTLQSVRQAVLDTKAAVAWLKFQGFEDIGIVGTSIGSCTAFLAMVHDANLKVGVFNHVSGYFADVVWRGISTYHVRESLEKAVSLEDLREFWLPISPLAFVEKLKTQKHRPMRYIYTLYDLSFPVDLSRATVREFKKHGIRHDKTVLPCGHYTLGEPPWVYLDGWKIVSYFRKHL
jgi:dienelactone hydrolase